MRTGTLDAYAGTMSFLDVQDLATVAAQSDLWWLIERWYYECDVLLDTVELAAVAVAVGLLLKRGKIDL